MQGGKRELQADVAEGIGMAARLGAQAVRKIEEEQPGKRMHPAPQIEKREVPIERLQELVELIN